MFSVRCTLKDMIGRIYSPFGRHTQGERCRRQPAAAVICDRAGYSLDHGKSGETKGQKERTVRVRKIRPE